MDFNIVSIILVLIVAFLAGMEGTKRRNTERNSGISCIY